MFEYNGLPLSESMIFGMGSCLSFEYTGTSRSPIITGRTKLSDFERNIYNRLRIKMQMEMPKDYDTAFHSMKKAISGQKPVMAYVDLGYLKYMNMSTDCHFGGHSVVVFGYDDNKCCFYVSDIDNKDWSVQTPQGAIASDFHEVTYDDMKKARTSLYGPVPANKKIQHFDFTKSESVSASAVCDSIQINAQNMLKPPYSIQGINGIRYFGQDVARWKNFEQEELERTVLNNYYRIDAGGGTGGGAFRNMYGHFLNEASCLLKNMELEHSGRAFLQISRMWDNVGWELMQIHQNGKKAILDKISAMILVIADKEEMEMKKLKVLKPITKKFQ